MYITLTFLKILKAIHIESDVQEEVKKASRYICKSIEMDYIRQIEDSNGRRMNALRPPHRKEVLKAREDDIKDKVKNWMSRESEARLKRISSELLEEYDSTELVASLLQELVEANDEVEVQLTFENH